jgi:cytochrome b6-f complex iron-sulfur subunit
MVIAIGVIAVLLLAVVALVATGRRRATTGRLSRETVQRDKSAQGSAVPTEAAPTGEETVAEQSDEARARADEARRAIESGASAVPEVATAKTPVRYEPVDEEEIGLSRRKFLNRAILTTAGVGVGAFGVAALGFLWPNPAGGFGGKINVGSVDDINSTIAKAQPFYNAGAQAYVQPYPKQDIPKAQKIPAYTPPIIAGMQLGYVALWQKCPHLGCRVPWCQTSQWFECPCHGSKYNRVGEKRAGPAPRGMTHFVFEISGGSMTIDTGNQVLGPPIGTDTTGQNPEGPLCV